MVVVWHAAKQQTRGVHGLAEAEAEAEAERQRQGQRQHVQMGTSGFSRIMSAYLLRGVMGLETKSDAYSSCGVGGRLAMVVFGWGGTRSSRRREAEED